MGPVLEVLNHCGHAAGIGGEVRGVDLADVAQTDDLGVASRSGDQALQLLWRKVLGLVDDQEGVVEGASTHEARRPDLYA